SASPRGPSVGGRASEATKSYFVQSQLFFGATIPHRLSCIAVQRLVLRTRLFQRRTLSEGGPRGPALAHAHHDPKYRGVAVRKGFGFVPHCHYLRRWFAERAFAPQLLCAFVPDAVSRTFARHLCRTAPCIAAG